MSEVRGAIGAHSTSVSNGAWDAAANVARIPNDAGAATLRKEFAWVDSGEDPDAKGSYKFPHHEVSSSGAVGDAVMAGCSAGIAVLNGGRGGASIPDADKQGVWAHLAKHLRDGGNDSPPPLRSGSDPTVERRVFSGDVEVRSEGNGFAFRGYAAVFNKLSDDLGGFREQVGSSAFNKTIKEADVRALINHDANLVLGRNKSGTLRLGTDSQGLYADADLPDTSYARDLYTLLERGDVNQMSFAFSKIRDSWNRDTKPPTRTLDEVRLHDVSVVTYPAYPQTSAEARAFAAAIRGEDFAVEGFDIDFRAISALEEELRQGKMLSSKNMDLIRAAMEALMSLMNAAEPDPATQAAKQSNSAPDESATQIPLSVLEAELRLVEATI